MNDELIKDLKALDKFNQALLTNIPICLIHGEEKYIVTGYTIEHYLVGDNYITIKGYSEDNAEIRQVCYGRLFNVLQSLKIVEHKPVYNSLFD